MQSSGAPSSEAGEPLRMLTTSCSLTPENRLIALPANSTFVVIRHDKPSARAGPKIGYEVEKSAKFELKIWTEFETSILFTYSQIFKLFYNI